MMKIKVKSNACAFDPDNLDDWLESDLRQSGILPSKCDKSDKSGKDGKCSKYLKIEELNNWETRSFCDGPDDKTVVGDSEMDKTTNDTGRNTVSSSSTSLSSSAQLPPIIKAFLAKLQQQQQQGIMIPPLLPFRSTSTSSSPTLVSSSSASSSTPDSINPLHISKTPGIPSMNNTKTSTFESWNTSTTTPTPTKKRRREVNSAPDLANVMDPLVLKRLKNTDAARRSRQRKLMKMEGLQTRVAELEKLNEQLRSQVIMAENERDAGKVKEAGLREKVATLEAQLAKAHQSLLENVKQAPLDPEKLGEDDDDGNSQACP